MVDQGGNVHLYEASPPTFDEPYESSSSRPVFDDPKPERAGLEPYESSASSSRPVLDEPNPDLPGLEPYESSSSPVRRFDAVRLVVSYTVTLFALMERGGRRDLQPYESSLSASPRPPEPYEPLVVVSVSRPYPPERSPEP